MSHLFAVYLGGMVQGCHIEMHDIRFVIGNSIEETYPQLRAEWIGTPESLHIDAFLRLRYVDGYEISVRKTPAGTDSLRLYFVNIGGYDPKKFAELHETGFFVAASPEMAKRRALEKLLSGKHEKHKDELYDIDECLEISQMGDFSLHLEPTDKEQAQEPDWFGYNTDVRKNP